jgi:uncharacterized protein YkuJ
VPLGRHILVEQFPNMSSSSSSSSNNISMVPSAFDSAQAVLFQNSFSLDDLPRARDDPLWNDIRHDFKLSLNQVAALKNYAASLPPVPKADVCFTFSPVADLQYCLDNIPDVTVRQALLGPGPCLKDAIESATNLPATEELEAMISKHLSWLHELANRPPVGIEYLLAIRLYTEQKPIPIFSFINEVLNAKDRKDRLKNMAPFMRLLIKALHLMVAAGFGVDAEAYRGAKISGSVDLRQKYDNYKQMFAQGRLVTFAGFTSASLDESIAEGFGDSIFFHLLRVRGVDVSAVSAYANEREILVIPPGVFTVSGAYKSNRKLIISLTWVEQRDAHYLKFDEHSLIEVNIFEMLEVLARVDRCATGFAGKIYGNRARKP